MGTPSPSNPPLRASTRWTIASHVRSVDSPDGQLVMDIRSGRYLGLNRVAAILWQQIELGADRAGILDHLRSCFPEVARDRLATDIDRMLDRFQASGLVVETTTPTTPSRAPAIADFAPPIEAGPQPLPELDTSPPVAAGTLAVIGAWMQLAVTDLMLRGLGFQRFRAWIDRTPTRETAADPADRVALSRVLFDRAASAYFHRAWCLQRSAATTRWLRRRGVPAEMVIGVRAIPFAAHAWVEVEGRVVNDRPAVRETYQEIDRC